MSQLVMCLDHFFSRSVCAVSNDQRIRLGALATSLCLLLGCADCRPNGVAVGPPFGVLEADFWPSERPIIGDIQSIALSLPVFDSGAAATADAIRFGDAKVVAAEGRWQLAGDGAQPSVVLEEDKRKEDAYTLTIGPSLDWQNGRPILSTWTYSIIRTRHGWTKMSEKVTLRTSPKRPPT